MPFLFCSPDFLIYENKKIMLILLVKIPKNTRDSQKTFKISLEEFNYLYSFDNLRPFLKEEHRIFDRKIDKDKFIENLKFLGGTDEETLGYVKYMLELESERERERVINLGEIINSINISDEFSSVKNKNIEVYNEITGNWEIDKNFSKTFSKINNIEPDLEKLKDFYNTVLIGKDKELFANEILAKFEKDKTVVVLC